MPKFPCNNPYHEARIQLRKTKFKSSITNEEHDDDSDSITDDFAADPKRKQGTVNQPTGKRGESGNGGQVGSGSGSLLLGIHGVQGWKGPNRETLPGMEATVAGEGDVKREKMLCEKEILLVRLFARSFVFIYSNAKKIII